jgi:hypothetical protein
MTIARPHTAQQFAKHLRALVGAGQHREAVAYAERFSREFLPQLSNEEHCRITGMMEGAATVVDLEDWEAGNLVSDGAAPSVDLAKRPAYATRR